MKNSILCSTSNSLTLVAQNSILVLGIEHSNSQLRKLGYIVKFPCSSKFYFGIEKIANFRRLGYKAKDIGLF